MSLPPPRGAVRPSGARAAAVALAAVAAACTTAAERAPRKEIVYPPAPRSDVVDDLHGTPVADPFRPLEDADAPATRAWIAAQNALTRAFLDAVPERAAIRERLAALWDHERFGVPVRRGGHLFFTRASGLQAQPVLLVADPEGRGERLLLDPNALSADGSVALVDWVPNRDGSLVAWAVSSGGSDWTEWRVRETATGRDRPDVLRWVKFSSVSWTADGRGFYYSGYDAPAEGEALRGANYHQRLRFHLLGSPQAEDALVYARPGEREWGFDGQVTEDGRHLVVTVWRGSEPRNLVLVREEAGPDAPFRALVDTWDASWDLVGAADGILFFRTDRGAPRGRIVAFDAGAPAGATPREIVPEGADVLASCRLAGHRLVVEVLRDARSAVRLHGTDGALVAEVALPEPGSVALLGGHPGDPDAWFQFSSFTRPPEIHRLDTAAGASTVFRAPALALDPGLFVTEQIFIASRDGTRVPVFLVRRRDLAPDGAVPTLLTAYGGFRISVTPSFSVQNVAWVERGGLLAVANIRGGGEYGEAWHEAARRENRPRAFEDFEAAAEALVARGWTRPDRLAIAGGSNGGLLVGACMTRRPDLFGAAVPAVGVLDMLRFHRFTIGWAWVGEYGSADEPGDFPFLHAYSPLHNLRRGTRYPATLVTTADHDDRVVPAHSYKFAAALQEAQGGPAPVLLRVSTRTGHGPGKPTLARIEESTDVLAFLVETLGATPRAATTSRRPRRSRPRRCGQRGPRVRNDRAP